MQLSESPTNKGFQCSTSKLAYKGREKGVFRDCCLIQDRCENIFLPIDKNCGVGYNKGG